MIRRQFHSTYRDQLTHHDDIDLDAALSNDAYVDITNIVEDPLWDMTDEIVDIVVLHIQMTLP